MIHRRTGSSLFAASVLVLLMTTIALIGGNRGFRPVSASGAQWVQQDRETILIVTTVVRSQYRCVGTTPLLTGTDSWLIVRAMKIPLLPGSEILGGDPVGLAAASLMPAYRDAQHARSVCRQGTVREMYRYPIDPKELWKTALKGSSRRSSVL